MPTGRLFIKTYNNELYPKNTPFTLAIKKRNKDMHLTATPTTDNIPMVFGQLIEKLKEIKQLLLTELSWQYSSDVQSKIEYYYVPALQQEVVFQLLSLCFRHIDPSSDPCATSLRVVEYPEWDELQGIAHVSVIKEGIYSLLFQQFAFESIFTLKELLTLRELQINSAKFLQDKSNEKMTTLSKLCDPILLLTGDKPSARMLHNYYLIKFFSS